MVDRLRFGASDGAASDVPSVRYVPSAFRGRVAVVVRAHDGTTYGLRSADCERRGGEVAGPGADPTRCDASFSQPGSDATSVLARKLLLDFEVSVRPEELAVRLRDCSRSRSRSSMISLSVRFRQLDAARAATAGGRARGVCSDVLLSGTFRGIGGGRATSLPFSFSRPVRRNTAGFTFSLSSTTTSSSSWPESVVGGVDGFAGGDSVVEAGEGTELLDEPGTERKVKLEVGLAGGEGADAGAAGADAAVNILPRVWTRSGLGVALDESMEERRERSCWFCCELASAMKNACSAA